MKPADILSIGEPLAEFNQTRPGEREYLQGYGGDSSNAAAALSTTGFGAVAPLPRPDAVRRLLDART